MLYISYTCKTSWGKMPLSINGLTILDVPSGINRQMYTGCMFFINPGFYYLFGQQGYGTANSIASLESDGVSIFTSGNTGGSITIIGC